MGPSLFPRLSQFSAVLCLIFLLGAACGPGIGARPDATDRTPETHTDTPEATTTGPPTIEPARPPAVTATSRTSPTSIVASSTATLTSAPTVNNPLTPSTPALRELDGTPASGWAIQEEYHLGQYFVREWCAADQGDLFGCYVTIEASGQAAITQYGRLVREYLGIDLTGNGDPDVVVFSTPLMNSSRGNTFVFNLGSLATKVFASPSIACRGEFQDLDSDGRYEYITCDVGPATSYCAGITTALAAVKVILEYDERLETYVPASSKYSNAFVDELARTRAIAAAAEPNAWGEGDNTTKCQVLPLVLTYLYLGDQDSAWMSLGEYYLYPDLADFRVQIMQAVQASPLFSEPASTTP